MNEPVPRFLADWQLPIANWRCRRKCPANGAGYVQRTTEKPRRKATGIGCTRQKLNGNE